MAETVHNNSNYYFPVDIKERARLYINVFHQIKETMDKDIATLHNKENEIYSKRKEFSKFYLTLNVDKYNSEIFDHFKSLMKSFKMELQLAALNANIKSKDIKDFSNIISVIGLSMEEESLKVISMFDELSNVFKKLLENFNHISDEVNMMSKVNIQFSEKYNRCNDYILSYVIPFFENICGKDKVDIDDYEKIKLLFNEVINTFNQNRSYIHSLRESQLNLNLRNFLHNIMINFRRSQFLLKEFSNFVLKIQYLALITKMEVGRIGEKEFVMVVTPLEKIAKKAYDINEEINKIHAHFFKAFIKFSTAFSKFSNLLRRLFFVEYFKILKKTEKEIDAIIKFFKNELERF